MRSSLGSACVHVEVAFTPKNLPSHSLRHVWRPNRPAPPARGERGRAVAAAVVAHFHGTERRQAHRRRSVAAPGEEREQAEPAPSYHELKDENEALRREVEALKAAFEEANERASTVARTMRKQDDIRLTLLTAAHDEAVRARDEARVDAAELRMRLEEAKTEMAGLRSRATLHELEAAAEAFSAAHQQAAGATGRGCCCY